MFCNYNTSAGADPAGLKFKTSSYQLLDHKNETIFEIVSNFVPKRANQVKNIDKKFRCISLQGENFYVIGC
jgi:hypothetical protein